MSKRLYITILNNSNLNIELENFTVHLYMFEVDIMQIVQTTVYVSIVYSCSAVRDHIIERC